MSIPIVDISSLRATKLSCQLTGIGELSDALHHTGFVGIQGHGIDQSLIKEVRAEVVQFFSRPNVEKTEHLVSPKNYRGYIPLGFFTPNSANKEADLYEGYKLHYEVSAQHPIAKQCDLYGPNLWPSNSSRLRTLVTEYWAQCDTLTKQLLKALFFKLELPLSFIEDALRHPLSNMTLLHYPPAPPAEGHFGIHPHKDTDALTILATDEVGGLYVQSRNSNDWVEVKVPSETLVVNVGDMLETWTAGYFVSTPHKVVNMTGKDRYSFPYFSVPRHDVKIKPLRNHDQGEAFLDSTAGEISTQIWRSNWPDAQAIDQKLDPYIA